MEISATLPEKVKWKEQLVLGQRGLELRRYTSVAKPTQGTQQAFKEALDRMTPRGDYKPQIPVKMGKFGSFNFSGSKRGRLSLLGLSGKRLTMRKWSHVTASDIDQALQAWVASGPGQ